MQIKPIIFSSLICLYAHSAYANGAESFLSGLMQGAQQAQERKNARAAHEDCVQRFSAETCYKIEAEMAHDQQAQEQQRQHEQEMEQLRQEVDEAQTRAAIAERDAQQARQQTNFR